MDGGSAAYMDVFIAITGKASPVSRPATDLQLQMEDGMYGYVILMGL
jgi:hypothetical protein